MCGEVGPPVMTPRPRRVFQGPVIVQITVESKMIGTPAVGSSIHALTGLEPIPAKVVQVPREQLSGLVAQSSINLLSKRRLALGIVG